MLVRILNHKYEVAAQRLDRVQLSLNQGLLIDMRRPQRQLDGAGGSGSDGRDESERARQEYERLQQHMALEKRLKRRS